MADCIKRDGKTFFFFLALSVNNNDCNAITVLQFIQLSLKSCHPASPALDFPHQKDE